MVGGSASETDELPISEDEEQASGGQQPEPETEQPSSEHPEPEQEPETGEAFGRCEVCRIPLVRPGKRCAGHREQGIRRPRRSSAGRGRPIQAPLLMTVPDVPDAPSPAAQTPSRPAEETPDPFAPVRVCGCGRSFRDRNPAGRCPDCVRAEQDEAASLAARRGLHQEASNA